MKRFDTSFEMRFSRYDDKGNVQVKIHCSHGGYEKKNPKVGTRHADDGIDREGHLREPEDVNILVKVSVSHGSKILFPGI